MTVAHPIPARNPFFSLPSCPFSILHSPVPWLAQSLRVSGEMYLAEWAEARAQSSRTYPIDVTVTTARTGKTITLRFIYSKVAGRFNNSAVGGFDSISAALDGTLAYVAARDGFVQLNNPVTGPVGVRLQVGA